MKLTAAVLMTLVVLAGCGGSDDDARSDAEQGKTEPTRTPGRPVLPGPSDNLLAFHRTGGIAGVDEQLFVRPDGAARVEFRDKAERFELTPAELDELRAAIDAAGFESLKPRYTTGGGVADGFVIDVTAGGRTVTVEQPAEPPPKLGDLMALANELIERHR